MTPFLRDIRESWRLDMTICFHKPYLDPLSLTMLRFFEGSKIVGGGIYV